MADDQATAATGKTFLLQKIYIKDLSFESPRVPELFMTNAAAETQLNISSSNRDVGSDNVEVTLTLTVESKEKDTTLFLIEIAQCGVFLLQGYTPEERAMMINSFCPSALYPFAREAIADITSKGGFPQLLLQPINFDAVYAQALREQAQAQGAEQQPAGSGEPN